MDARTRLIVTLYVHCLRYLKQILSKCGQAIILGQGLAEVDIVRTFFT